MRHRLTIETLALMAPDARIVESDQPAPIEHCERHHMDELRIQEIDIEKNVIQIRCRPCKVSYHLTIKLFETYQP